MCLLYQTNSKERTSRRRRGRKKNGFSYNTRNSHWQLKNQYESKQLEHKKKKNSYFRTKLKLPDKIIKAITNNIKLKSTQNWSIHIEAAKPIFNLPVEWIWKKKKKLNLKIDERNTTAPTSYNAEIAIVDITETDSSFYWRKSKLCLFTFVWRSDGRWHFVHNKTATFERFEYFERLETFIERFHLEHCELRGGRSRGQFSKILIQMDRKWFRFSADDRNTISYCW